MPLFVSSFNSNKVVLSSGANSRFELNTYSETSKKIWECVRYLLRLITCGCLKFDDFISISKNIYILPDQIKESFRQLEVELPSCQVCQENLAKFIILVPEKSQPVENPVQNPTTKPALEPVSASEDKTFPLKELPPAQNSDTAPIVGSRNETLPPTELPTAENISQKPSDSAPSFQSDSNKGIASTDSITASSTVPDKQTPQKLADAIIGKTETALETEEIYSEVFFAPHIDPAFKQYTFIEKLQFLYALVSHSERYKIKHLVQSESIRRIAEKIIETTDSSEEGLDRFKKLLKKKNLSTVVMWFRVTSLRILKERGVLVPTDDIIEKMPHLAQEYEENLDY